MRGSLKFLMLRKSFVQKVLNVAGFKIISGHWVYCSNINKDSIVLDLGANEGKFSREISDRYRATCYAVEPDKNMFNGIKDLNIVKLNYAISNDNGPIDFYVSNNNEASSTIKDFENNWGIRETNVVEGIAWESLIELLKLRNKRIHIIKVDIEGSELDLINSFNANNISNVEQITIEFHDWLNKSLHKSTVEAIEKLVSLGFIVISNTPDHSWPVEMLFINRKLIRLNFFKNLLISFYERITFLKY